MRNAIALFLILALTFGLGACATTKRKGKPHRRPSGGSGNNSCDCPSFGYDYSPKNGELAQFSFQDL